MAYQYVPARFDVYGPRAAPARALVVHMAEGGGTVGYLSRTPQPGTPQALRRVSVHYVIEYNGEVVQMLRLDRISGSINPRILRSSNDAPFIGYNGESIIFGISARKLVLGAYDRDPNRAIITVEVEGYAHRGPNKAQRISLVNLYRRVTSELPSIRGLLGHRDFTTVKMCPGRLIPWANMAMVTGGGRHGLMTSAERERIRA